MQKSILVIDDDEDDLHFLKEALLETGLSFNVYSATSGKLGLVLLKGLKGYPPSLIILDSKIAMIDRFEIVARIKKEYDIPVLIYTPIGADSIIEDAKVKGANYCLKKSNTLAELKETVKIISAFVN